MEKLIFAIIQKDEENGFTIWDEAVLPLPSACPDAVRKAEVKRIKEEAYKRKLARLKYFKGESVTVEPIPLDYEALKKKYDLLFNPANRKSVEVTYSLQNCVDENGIPTCKLEVLQRIFSLNL